ncbi:Pyrophosphate-energized membrane proton pump 3, partial [Cucurbita argyrosperma subsp. sororia]
MWRLKVADGGNDPYIYSMNNFVGRQIWEFDPDAGSPDERDEVERVRNEFTKNRLKGFPSADLLWRLQLLREKNFKQSIPPVKVEDGEEITYEMASDAMKRGAYFLEAIQASDGHWPSETSGPLFYLCPLLICMYIMGFMDSAFSPEHKKEMMRYLYNHQNEDGGWGLHVGGHSNMFCTTFNYISLRLLGEEPDVEAVARGRIWIRDHGGVTSILSWGKTWLSILNLFDWSASNPMPPEYWMFPTWVPIHPSNMMCYTRITYMPMSYLYGKRFQAPLTPLVLQLRDELHTQAYEKINWRKVRHMCATEDLYFPHPFVQDLLWDTLYMLSEPLMTRWPFNKLIRQKALDETMRHIHYEDENSRYITIGCVEKPLCMLACWVEDPNIGEKMEPQRFYDAVNVILNMQSKNGGLPAWEPASSYYWMEWLNPVEFLEDLIIEHHGAPFFGIGSAQSLSIPSNPFTLICLRFTRPITASTKRLRGILPNFIQEARLGIPGYSLVIGAFDILICGWVNSSHTVVMDDDIESASLGVYQDRPRTFPDMRSKVNTPLIFRILMGINIRVLLVLLLFAFGLIFYVGARTSPIIVFVFSVCIVSFCFSIYLTKWVLSKDEGPPEMAQISEAIRDGAEGFFRTQYSTISKMAMLLAVVILCIYLFRSTTPQQESSGIGRSTTAYITVAAFLLGALCSGIAGYVGMWVSVRANVRVSSAARRSAREALQIAVRAGGFSAIVVVGMAVIGIAILYASFHVWLDVGSPGSTKVTDLPLLLVGYGFGASFVALFAQLGGGIYTKAADVGADLVGKVEQGIPEDDPRNPAVIADLVGDNVGDCAARGADLFESIAAEIISAMILGGTMAQRCKIEDPSGFILFPLVVHSFDLVISSIGILSIRRGTRESGVKSPVEDPMTILQRGYSVTIVLAVITFGVSTRWLLHTEQAPSAWFNFALCGLVGIITAYIFVWITKYYTDYKHEPVRSLALSSSTGHGTNIIAGVSLGLESTALPVLVISVSIVSAFWLGRTSGLVDEDGNPTGGLFGTAVATMGMLSTAAYVLTMDMFGPIADNAGGIVEMSQQPESVREITDLLDAVGNTTKATTKGFAIGSAALASFLLFSAYMDEVATFAHEPFKQVDIAIPEVFVGGLLGSMLIYLFSAWACSAVGRTAQEVVKEVRKQFLERPGIMDYTEKPEYGRCVAIVASASLREMIKPGALAIISPMAVGFLFRILGHYTGQPLLGAKVVAAMLMFATVSGILMALFLNTAGGAWDNAKKYIETGVLGGKGSDSHKAAVTGDTVGDPFKDTAGPSLHVLIKMLATITLVMAPIFL